MYKAAKWTWDEAFDKFGFDDGDGTIFTGEVVRSLKMKGYEVSHIKWGPHNEIITSIKLDGAELISEDVKVGYDDPRSYLPKNIISYLDREFPENKSRKTKKTKK